MIILVPPQVYIGDTIEFVVPAFNNPMGEQVDSGSYTLKWYARTNENGKGATVTGVAEDDGWKISVSPETTALFVVGNYTWQAIATKSGAQYTAGRGQFSVKASAAYENTPAAFDDRSRAELDLQKVEESIRTLASGGMVQEYTIGGRNLKRYKMGELLSLRDTLKAEVDRERRAEKIRQGLGNPGVTRVRFI